MNIKNDNVLGNLRSFGFTCEEKTQEGFLRYQKRIGNLMITIANGQFENKIRVSMLQDKEGRIRTSYKDILAYSDLLQEMIQTGLIGEQEFIAHQFGEDIAEVSLDEYDASQNPLIGAIQKPKGFMAQ